MSLKPTITDLILDLEDWKEAQLDTRYLIKAGVTGGQTAIGGTAITDILKLQGTSGNGTLTSPAIQALVGNNGATTALTILNNGNVGVGTTSPNELLHVSADADGHSARFDGRVGIGVDPWDNTTYSLRLIKGIYSGGTFYTSSHIRGAAFRSNTTGSTSAPVFTYNSDTNTGMYFPADDTLAFTTAATERLRIDSTGNVGIGTTSPSSLLHLKAGTATVAPFKLTAGTNLTTPENGALEYDGTDLFFTTGDTRYKVTLEAV